MHEIGLQIQMSVALCQTVHKRPGCKGVESSVTKAPMKSHYETLEVSPLASASVIRAAYRCLAQRHHPDKNLHSDDAGLRLASINGAYSILSDPAKRKEYDLRQGIPGGFVERRGHGAWPDAPRVPRNAGSAEFRPFAFRPLI
jgi:curved DNA-binding protein CbpA